MLPLIVACGGSESSKGAYSTGTGSLGGSATATGGAPNIVGNGGSTIATTSAETSVAPMGTGGNAAGGTSNIGGISAVISAPSTGGAVTASSGPQAGSTAAGGPATGGIATGGTSLLGGSASGGGWRASGGFTETGGVATRASTSGNAVTGGNIANTGAAATGGSSNTVSTATGSPETKPNGYGQATTGCGSSNYQTAASLSAIQSLIDAYSGTGGLCIKYTGTFDFSSITDPCAQHGLSPQTLEIKKKSDITIMGADGSAANFGVHIAASSSNVIVRNMTFGLLPGGSDSDAISIEGMSGSFPTNIWIDHNELFSALVECAGAGDSSFDGLIDAKKGADNITVSYNYVHDHAKVSLNGYSDSDTEVRHITFHHNVFQHLGSRTPLQRGGYSHMLNNYFNDITVSGINVRMTGYSLIEGNYFENCQNPVTSRDSDAIGYWDLRGNNVTSTLDFSTYKITWVASTSTPTKDATDWTTTASYPVALGYSYAVDPPACLKAGLKNAAGAGKGLETLTCK